MQDDYENKHFCGQNINYLILKIESIYPHADNSQNYDVLINHVTLEVFI